jgi:hypothetical protein
MAWPTLKLKYGHGENYPLPLTFIRTALFSSMRYRGRERPQYTQKTAIANYSCPPLSQLAGEQLDGNDLDVIAGCIRLVYDANLLEQEAATVQFQEKTFLRQIGWPTGGTQRSALAESLKRMQTAVFEFDAIAPKDGEENRQQTSLIVDFSRSLDGNRMSYSVTLNADIAALMQAGRSLVRRLQRNALRDTPLAQSLHAFYETHSEPIPLSENKLRPLMARKGKRDDKWRGSLRAAIAAMQAATGWECDLSEAGMVTVKKSGRPRNAVQPAVAQSEPITQPAYDDDI